MKYRTILELLDLITDTTTKNLLLAIYHKFRTEMHTSQGSQHNHQVWAGGYIDHVVDMMNIARLLYITMNDKRKLDFQLSDALVVIFLHDIEKAFPSRIVEYMENGLSTRSKAKSKIKYRIIHEERLWDILNSEQKNALDNAEGENESYTNKRRIMGPLAAFVHICDVTSARIWFDNPKEEDSWGHRVSVEDEQQLWGV